MSQATLPERPYVNSNLFSGHYLDERVQERQEWECDEAAREALVDEKVSDLQPLTEVEFEIGAGSIRTWTRCRVGTQPNSRPR